MQFLCPNLSEIFSPRVIVGDLSYGLFERARYLDSQQHLSKVLPVNLHVDLPFCMSQQHVFTYFFAAVQ